MIGTGLTAGAAVLAAAVIADRRQERAADAEVLAEGRAL